MAVVKEIPDLNKIVKQMEDSSFDLLTIIDETYETLRDSNSRFEILDQLESDYYEFKEELHCNKKINLEIVTDGKKNQKRT